MKEKELKQAVEELKKLFIKMHIELNLTTVGGSNSQKLMREIEDVVSRIDPEIGAKLKNTNRRG